MWKKYNKYAGAGSGGLQTQQLQTGRRSACGDDTQEGAAMEAELTRLQRLLHVMEGDRRSYSEESNNILRKQQEEIRQLKSESDEIKKVLRLAKSDKNEGIDSKNTLRLLTQITRLDIYQGKVMEEKKDISKLEEEILATEESINTERKQIGSLTEEQLESRISKQLHVTENRLDQATIKFNKQLTTNANLRSELDHLRQEKAVFDAIKKRLTKKLNETKAEISKNIEQASQAYEGRDEAQSKMMALKERSDKDMNQQEIEMKELKRFIQHDNKLKEFMGIKVADRAELKEEEQIKKRKGKEASNKHADSDTETMAQLEDAINKVRSITGEKDISKVVHDFICKEDQIFALYNFVNELNDTVDKYTQDINLMTSEIQRFQDDEVKHEESRMQMLKEMETKVLKFSREREKAEKRNVEICKVLDELRSGVSILFRDADCDPSAVSEMLGSEEGVTKNNILQYMGIIEQQTMRLLQLEQYNQMKKEAPPKKEKRDSKVLTAPPILIQAQKISPRVVAVALPNSMDDDDSLEDGEVRPLTRNELKTVVMKNLNPKSPSPRKKSQMKTQKNASPKSS